MSKNLITKNQIPRKEALSKIASSQILLLLLNRADNAEGRIPGKLFEYLYVKRPMVALGQGPSDVQGIVEDTKSGMYFTYDEKEYLMDWILQRYQLFKLGGNTIEGAELDKYSLVNLSEKISNLLESVI